MLLHICFIVRSTFPSVEEPTIRQRQPDPYLYAFVRCHDGYIAVDRDGKFVEEN